MKALIIDEPWINYIQEGKKVWEMRSTQTKIRGQIYLIKKGTGKLWATANLVDSIGPFSIKELHEHQEKHCIPHDQISSILKWSNAWVLKDIQKLDTPIKYNHLLGAVIWVNV